MLKSNLIEAFKSFTSQEMKAFSEFVASPFFNKNVNVIKLFEAIRKHYPEFEAEKIEKEKIYKRLFPDKPYKDSTIRLLMFYLYELVEEFLAYNHFRQSSPTYAENLLKELLERGLYKEFEKNIDKINREIESTLIKDESFYMNRFIFRYEYLNYASNFVEGRYEKFVNREDIEFVSNNLTYYYLIRILKFYSVALNMMALYNISINTAMFENIMKNFNPDSFHHVPLIAIYYNAIMLLIKPEEEFYYHKMKKLVFENMDSIEKNTLSDLFINLENYCHRKGRTGSEAFFSEALEIYNAELDRDTCFVNGFIPYSLYNSYVVTACRLGKFDEALEFIEKYKDYLSPENKTGYYNYTRAFLEDAKGNYEKALELLSKVKLDDLYIKMDIKVLQSRIYYSLSWHLPLQSLLDTFKKTVQNNKLIPEFRKKYFLQYIRYLNQMNNIKQKPDPKKLAELKNQLNEEEYFPYKQWLLNNV